MGRTLSLAKQKSGDVILAEGPDGTTRYMFEDTIRELFLGLKQPIELVTLSCCHSGQIGETILKTNANHVICVDRDKRLENSLAIKFAENFYS